MTSPTSSPVTCSVSSQPSGLYLAFPLAQAFSPMFYRPAAAVAGRRSLLQSTAPLMQLGVTSPRPGRGVVKAGLLRFSMQLPSSAVGSAPPLSIS
ncbi:hypothetical protein NDU88_005391 [Pleurodeles waltl]|uniref:Uncharacterized protein n=1 Tax=Pleurodeles waltl TaxID=8319 RepID=A0AAV7NNW8_PLEWA|nr:hypothetical protein NDU88_005391 [Pleurodeles waltl]